MHTIFENIKTEQVLVNEAKTATFSVELDTQGFNLNSFLIDFGVDAALDASNNWSFKLQESDETGTGQVDVADSDKIAIKADNVLQLDSNGDRVTSYDVDSTDKDDVAILVEYLRLAGCKRYVTLVGTVTGTVSSPIGVISVQGRAEVSPVNE